jgi:hypothetical protein
MVSPELPAAYAKTRREMTDLLRAGWKAALPPGVRAGEGR